MMQQFVARQTMRLAVGVLGAVLLAAAVAALAEPQAGNFPGFLIAFGNRLTDFLQLRFGSSVISDAPVLKVLAERLPPTLLLVVMGSAVALLVGVPMGLVLSLGSFRRISAPLVQVITATPVFCAGLALAYAAAHLLNWPVSVNAPVGDAIPPNQLLQITALPVLTVGLAGAAAVQLALRRSTAGSSGESFRTGLKRLGLGIFEIEILYVLPEVVAGLLNGAGEIMLALLSAAVVAEWVFHRAGAADLFVKSVALADWTMAGILLFVFAAATFIVTFLGKVLAHAVAPEDRP